MMMMMMMMMMIMVKPVWVGRVAGKGIVVCFVAVSVFPVQSVEVEMVVLQWHHDDIQYNCIVIVIIISVKM